MSSTEKIRIGIDLGGTKIEIIALDSSGETLLRQRCATPAGDYLATIAAITAAVTQAEHELGAAGTVGVGMPGALSRRTGLVKNANSTVLNGKLFKEDLQNALGRSIRIENDANCFAVSEATDGAGRNMQSVFGVILGTGVGGGLVVDGKLLVGAANIAGEWGHNPLPAIGQLGLNDSSSRELAQFETPGPRCYCGRWGCVETWISGPALVADYLRLCAGEGMDPGSSLDAQQVIERMQNGEAAAGLAFDRYLDRLARSLATVVNIVDPDVIVLGGGMSRIEGLAAKLGQSLVPYVFSDEIATRIRVNFHGDSSGVRGAAWLWD